MNEKGPELFSQGGKTFLMTGAAGGSVTPLNTGAGPGVAAMGGGGTSVSLSMPIMVMTDEESGRPEGAELDTECKPPPTPTAWFMEPVEPNLTERMLNELSESPATAIKD